MTNEMDWEHEGKPPKFDDINVYQVWVNGYVRLVRRVGNRSMFLSPGTLAFVDCNHPLQNVICDEKQVQAWRLAERNTQ